MASSENSGSIVQRHHKEYQTAYNDAVAAKGSDTSHKPDSTKKLASDLADIQKADPAYFKTIMSQLNGKFKAEDFGLPSGEKLLGGVQNGSDASLVSRSADGSKINYYGGQLAGDSNFGKVVGRVGQVDGTTPSDPRGSAEGPASLLPKKQNDGSGQYTEGKDDHSMWDVARHVLGYDKLDTLAKKNEAANLIKLLGKDPENAKKIKEGTVLNVPPLTYKGLPGAPTDAQPAKDQIKAAEDTGALTVPQATAGGKDKTVEDLIQAARTPGAKPDLVKQAAEAKIAAISEDNANMSSIEKGVFNPKAAALLNNGDADPSHLKLNYRDLDDDLDSVKAAQKKIQASGGKPDVDLDNLTKALQFMKGNWGKFEVGGMSTPDLDAAGLKRLIDRNTFNIETLKSNE